MDWMGWKLSTSLYIVQLTFGSFDWIYLQDICSRSCCHQGFTAQSSTQSDQIFILYFSLHTHTHTDISTQIMTNNLSVTCMSGCTCVFWVCGCVCSWAPACYCLKMKRGITQWAPAVSLNSSGTAFLKHPHTSASASPTRHTSTISNSNI